ncbi:AAA family ATPase [Nocardia sp. NPDC055321]
MSGNDPLRALRGRRAESERLNRLLADARAGRSQVLVLRGEAGIGKSALLDHLVGSAQGWRVVRAAGVESHMELAFAGLHQLCAPMMAQLDRLPGPQREALAVAFGLRAGPAPDRFLVGLAVLTLLAEVAEEQPLICVIDDAQWLDQVSAQTLAFVARRLLAERVALVFAVRDTPADRGAGPLAGLPDHVLRGLRDGDARAVLESAIPARLDERVTDRIIAEAHGNPLALLELPRGMTAAELAGGFGRPDSQPLTSQIEQSFVRRIAELPAAAQLLLLAAAADPVGDALLVRRAAERLGIGVDATTAVESAGLIEFGARVRFRHPLVRSAAYRTANSRDRRAVHLVLAELTDPDTDPDRRAWHRATAAVEPDETVADELERSAVRAQARGGLAAAAAFLRRATSLTPDLARRGTRALAAARAAFEAGAPDTALELLNAAEMGLLDELERARLTQLRGRIVLARKRGGDALPLLLDAARRLEALDVDQSRETYLEALGSAIYASRLHSADALSAVARAAQAAPHGRRTRRLVDVLLDVLATRFAEGYTVGVATLMRELSAFSAETAGDEDVMRWHWLASQAAIEMWDEGTWHELTTHAVRAARQTGALNFLPQALTNRAAVHLHAGEFDVAAALVEESESITRVTGNAPLGYTGLLLAAWRGADDRSATVIQTTVDCATTWGEGRAIGQGHYALAVLYNGLGRYRQACDSAEKACEHDDLGVFGPALVELVESAARSGSRASAETALRQLEERVAASGTDWALGVLARSRALLSAGESADLLYREAIDRLGRGRIVVQLARAHLVYGEWLRGENRREEARARLRTAHEMLNRFGATGFAERARRELSETGESVRQRSSDVREVLTTQEAQIAKLARDGLTNTEIGAELFISARTVEWHLRKVFGKLDIASRRELRAALED